MKTTLKNGLSKDVKVFEKSVPVAAIFLIVMVATGSAALLATYGTITGTAEIEQSVVVEPDEFSFNGVVAGSSIVDDFTIENRAEADEDVLFTTRHEDSDENNVPHGIDTEYLVLDGEGLISESGDNSDASAEFVYDDEAKTLAVHATTEIEDEFGDDGHETASAGVLLDHDAAFDGSNTVSVDYRIGDDHHETRDAPDWIAYVVTATEDVDVGDESIADGETVIVIDATVDGDGTTVDFTMGEDEIVFSEDGETRYSDIMSGDLMDVADIEQVKVATGTDSEYGSGTASDLYYHDVRFNGDTLFTYYEDSEEFTVDAGTAYDAAILNQFDIALAPDDYTVESNLRPSNWEEH